MDTIIWERAVCAARNAAMDAIQKGWWSHSTALPVRFRKGPGWVICRSIEWTTKWDGQYVPSGMLLAAALRAASRSLGVKPNNEVAISVAVYAASAAGSYDLSAFDTRKLVTIY